MSDETPQARAPTLLDRFWWALGYRGRYPDDEQTRDWAGYWGRTDTIIRLSWGDRFRLLLSGRAILRVQHDFEHDPGTIKNVSAFEVQRPVLSGDEGAPK